jgi:hypothetical protein
MRTLRIIIYLISILLIAQTGYSYTAVTLDLTTACQNYSFDNGLMSWQALTTAGYTSIDSSTNYHGCSVVFLKANYAKTTNGSEAAVSPLYPVELYGTPRDGLQVKVHFMGMDTMSACTVTGMFSVELKGGLSIYSTGPTINANDTTADNRILQRGFIQSWSSNSVIGVMSTWNVFNIAFTPPSCDWWQLRQLKLSYKAAPNQKTPTGIAIDRVEIYATRIDP